MSTRTVRWIGSSAHGQWLQRQMDELLGFYRAAAADRANGGFWWVSARGAPMTEHGKQLWINARMVHCFALAHLAGRPGSADLVDHGLAFLDDGLRDPEHGGWFWAVDAEGEPTEGRKQAYGHAFVLLASCSALLAERPGARALLDDAVATIDARFWDDAAGMAVESYAADWTDREAYRGQNSNMHLVEALMAATEATGDARFVGRAVRIAERLIRDLTATNGWRLAEHYDESWTIQPDYNADDPDNLFRPYGSTVGHWLEWSRLLVQLHELAGADEGWMVDAATTMFAKAICDGWDEQGGGGFHLTVDWDGRPLNSDRYHWVMAEAIGAAVALHQHTGDPNYEQWYQRFWDFTARFVIDHEQGSWHHQLDARNRPSQTVWDGKPDLYHALQATWFARVGATRGVALGLAELGTT